MDSHGDAPFRNVPPPEQMTKKILALLALSCLAPRAGAEQDPAAAGAPAAAAPAVPAAAASPTPAAAPGEADEADDEEIDASVQSQSQELEELRAAEELTRPLDATGAGAEERVARAAARLGHGSPLRHRLEEALAADPGAAAEVAGGIPGLPELDHDLRRLQAEYDIPIEVNDAVVAYVRFFQHPKVRKHFVKWLGRAPRYLERFREILRQEGLPEDTVFLAMIESGFANLATSRARAVGPWQFIAATGRRMGLKQDFWVDERRDPEKAARAAARYLKELRGQLGDWRLAWAGYNAGAGKILRAQRKGYADFWSMTKGRRILKRETQGYVPKLMAAAIVTKHAEAFGFSREETGAESWTPYEVVAIPRATLLSHVARAAEVPERQLLDLNPELRRTCTPQRPFELKLPRGQGEVFARNWGRVSEEAGRLAFAHHRVQRGDTLAAIAQNYGVAVALVQRTNGLKPGRRLRPGAELVIPLSAAARREVAVALASEPEPRSTGHRQRPRTSPAPPPPAAPIAKVAEALGRARETVKVASGDSLWAIARRFGVAVDELCRWNGIRNARRHRLMPGDELVVYAPTPAAAARPPG
jgi:membrane-bound lytic murein transglycosylase D